MSAVPYLPQNFLVAPLGTQANPQAPNLPQQQVSPVPPLGTQENPEAPTLQQRRVSLAQSPPAVDFSGSYVDNFGETRVMVQNGNSGECSAGWKYTVSGDVATIVGHGINGKFRAGDPMRKIDWTNGVTYKDAQALQAHQNQIPQRTQAPTQGPPAASTQAVTAKPLSLDANQEKTRSNTSFGGYGDQEKTRSNTSFGGHGVPPGSPPGSLQTGCYSAQGLKPGNQSYVNQDAYVAMNLSESKIFVGVFDGHGKKGTELSALVKQTFVELSPSLVTTPDIPGTFRQIYADAVNRLRRDGFGADSGATATIALVDAAAQRAHVAHCGDSLCIVINKSGTISWMTREHKPSDPQEKQRLEANGSQITQNGRLILTGTDAHFGLARAIGDFVYEKQGVVGEPDISQSMLFEPGSAILLGSDGIWDMVPKEEHAKTVLSMQPQEAAQCIVTTSRGAWEKALRDGRLSHIDDITAVLVRFVPTEVST